MQIPPKKKFNFILTSVTLSFFNLDMLVTQPKKLQ